MTADSRIEQLYDFITTDEDGRTCEAISEEACTDVPRNFLLNALNGTASLLPQLAVAGRIRRFKKRKCFGSALALSRQ